ncbi:MAG: 16S rRNA (uracil(1498)-N(3))-methyltransferase [Candidatus Cloacimonetes bacterium]|nr:16S rRNA (uracil(1498)-N(3))-methyltransferase [Candidatus Cloacimonadota bacterium]
MPSAYFPGLETAQAGSLLRLEGEEFHHLARVAKRRLSEPLKLNSGEGTLAWANLESLERDAAILRVLSLERQPKPRHIFAIAFALLKNRHDELLVEKCVELGASALFPLITEHSVRQPAANTLARFARVSLAAIKQCDNPWLPRLHPLQGLASALSAIRAEGFTPILCSERQPKLWLHHFGEAEVGDPCFLIGPEGGWSEAEFKQMEGLLDISLGELVTRAETAAIAVASQWQAYANRLAKIN